MADDLEGIVNNPATGQAAPPPKPGEAKQEQPKSITNSVIGEIGDLFKFGAKATLAIGAPVLQSSIFPEVARDTAILTGAQVVGDSITRYRQGEKNSMGKIAESSLMGTILGLPTHYMFKYLNMIPLDSIYGYVGRAAALGGIAAPIFTALYQGVAHTVRNKTLKGAGTYIKENFWPSLKRYWKTIFPISVASVSLLSPYLQIPVAAALQIAYTFFGAPNKRELKEDEKRDPTPFYKTLGNLGHMAFTLPEKTLNGVYSLGSSIGNIFSSKPPPAAPAAVPQAA